MHYRPERKACSATVDPTFRSGPRATARYGTGGSAILTLARGPRSRAGRAQFAGYRAVKSLRQAMRRRRHALDAARIADTSLRIARHLWRLPALARTERIAVYMAVGGEVDCAPFIAQAASRGRRIFLPVLHGAALTFAPAGTPGNLVCNRFGIPEPAGDGRCWRRGADLDVVLMPLVAFDEQGRRLGMGGGYYDRTFRFSSQRGHWRRPWLIGLAYDFQRVDALPARRWDVPLHAVVTESGAQFF